MYESDNKPNQSLNNDESEPVRNLSEDSTPRVDTIVKRMNLASQLGSPIGKLGGWVSPWNYGINQGALVLMVENYRSGLTWELMRGCPYLVAGLRRSGFSGGWLENADLR